MLACFKQPIKLNRLYAYFFILIFSSFVALAIEECKGTVTQDEVPCYLLLSFNQSPLVCGDYSVNVYSNSTLLYSQTMGNYSPFKCNSTFNLTQLGTYNGQYSTGDTYSITVEEGNSMILMLYFAIILIIALLVFAIWQQDTTLASMGAILMIVMGILIATQGFSIVNNLVTQAIAIVFIAVGAYIFIKTNLENL